jgi:hypothetical protein
MLTEAMVTSIERAQGADRANNVVWKQRQVHAARHYASQLATLLNADPAKRRAAGTAFERSNFPAVSVSQSTLQPAQQQILKSGLPSSLDAALARLGFSRSERDDIRIEIATSGASSPPGSSRTFAPATGS